VKTLRLALLELRRFRGPLPRLVPLALALVPLVSAAVYLWSAWDPYGQLDRIPVAVVNQDRPVTSRGTLVDAGELLVEQLRQDRIFDWRFVEEGPARRGLQDGRYAFAITVPADFSAKLASPTGQAPQRASMLLTLNDAGGYLTGKLAETAQAKLQDQIDTAARTAFAQRVLGDLDALRARLDQASSAAISLRDGSAKAAEDAGRLTEQQRAAGQLATTNQQLTNSAQQLFQSVSGAAAAIADQVPTAAQAVVDATATAQRSTALAASGIATAQQQADLALGGLVALGQSRPELRTDPNFQLAMEAARQADRAAATAGVAAETASGSSQQASSSAQQVQSATGGALQQLRAATAQSSDLVRSAQQAADGADHLRTGLDGALTGARSLQAQLGRLQRGAGQLASGLHAAVQQIPPASAEQRARIADTLGAPVDLRTTNLHPAHVYGRGLAPLFCGIALWVFALAAYLVLRPLNPRALASRALALTVAVAGWLPAAAIGVAGALVLYGVLDAALGLDPLHPLWTIGLLVLSALAFVAAIHLLRTAFGLAGVALSLVLLAFQLTASGGLYPLETAPAPFRTIHPLSPITYVVDGLRVTISGGQAGHLIRAVIVLAAILLVSLALTTLVVARRRVWTVGRLKPSVPGPEVTPAG
jgi:putative membrane protein